MKCRSFKKLLMYSVLCCVVVFAVALIAGCQGGTGAPAVTTGSVSGTVTTAVGSVPLSGVSVSTNPSVGSPAPTDSSGHYSLVLPAGSYTLTFTVANFTSATANVSVAAGASVQTNVTMSEASTGAPSVSLTANQNVGYGQDFTATASAKSPVGGTLSYSWTGVKTPSTAETATATSVPFATALGGVAAPASDPGSYVAPFEQETRFGILPINDDTRGQKTVKVTVSDGEGGSTSVSIIVFSTGVQPGVKAVAVGVPVYLNSGLASDSTASTATTVWNPVTTPTGTTALSTVGTNDRNPWFVPTATGKYIVSTSTGSTMDIYAGTFAGAISDGGYATKTISAGDLQWDGMWMTIPSGVSSVTFTNWPTVTPDQGCMFCHDDSTAPDEFTPWSGTAHATFFARGLEGITPNNSTCEKCHTVGFDQSAAAANGGFDDAATSSGFVYNKAVGSWAVMWANNPTAARVSNIQCENCHGPQNNGGAHKTAGTNGASPSALRVTYSADDCGVCHASGTGHHNYSEWVESLNPDTTTSTSRGKGHSKKEQLDAYINPLTGQAGHARSTDGVCVRCHTAQGFAAYVDQLASGNAGSVPDSEITWDKSNAQPQTCIACHDPHSDANENQLRISDSLQTSMAGFGVAGVGKGALCMACHNERDGIQCASAPTGTGGCATDAKGDTILNPSGATFLHEDNDAYAKTRNDYMHDASQTEVLMGRDFFFMGNSLPMLSKHANVEDTCVGCHMTLNPQTHNAHGTQTVSGHVFYIKDADVPTLCANCHGQGTVDGEALQTSVENQLTALAGKIANNLLTRVQGQTIYVGSSHTQVVVGATTTVTYSGGSWTFNGTAKGNLTNITSDAAGTIPAFGPDDRLKKASWNWTMIEKDGSKGVHNPTLVTTVLNNTSAAMDVMSP